MRKWMFVGLVAVALSQVANAGQIAFCETPESILAEGFPGSWVQDQEIETRLGPTDEPGFSILSGTIVSDKKATRHFDERWFADKCIYLAGYIDFTHTKDGVTKNFRSPFVQSVLNGNPVIFVDENGNSDGTDDVSEMHPLYVMFAKGSEAKNDILFMGGDHNNQRLYALKRK